MRRNAKNRIETGRGRASDVQVTVVAERQVISGDGWLQRGEDVNLPRAADFENGAAAVADVKILFRVEGQPTGDAHAFHINRSASTRRDLVNDAIVAA